MILPKVRRVATRGADSCIRIAEEPIPVLVAGTVLVEVHASLVSPGSEVGGWHGLARRGSDPDPGAERRPFGYSNAGIVLATGDGVDEWQPGDRVACIGGGYALHTDYAVIPRNLCVSLPVEATFTQGAYAMLLATALHAIRRAQVEFGEFAAVVGLGLVGQLTAQMLALAGCFVIGWDRIGTRLDIARRCGIDAVVDVGDEDPIVTSRAFTGEAGLDLGVVAFGGDANDAIRALADSLKVAPDTHHMGRIVVVGGAQFEYPLRASFNVDIRHAGRTGPGYHDEAWEIGPAYPPVFMRWTTRTNLELCMRLIEAGRLQVDRLTTHAIPFADAEEGVAELLHDPDAALGVAFMMR
tara:strand:- start:362 stop:1423 length:1062 start_codon:yes stop_codon:yes gene_type:complete